MNPIIKQEDQTIAVNYGDIMSFIADNCDIKDYDTKWDYAEKLTNRIMSEETVSFHSLDHIKTNTNLSEEKQWLLNFFEAHPFIKRMVIYFND